MLSVIVERREQVPLSMAIENGVLMHECSPEHLRMGTARLNKTMKQRKKVRRGEWMGKEVPRIRKKELLSCHLISSSHVSHLTNAVTSMSVA